MRVVDVVQGSLEWMQVRRGLATASRFGEIMTPKTRKYSASARKLLYEVLAEDILQESVGFQGNDWTDRGQWLEDEAVGFYEFTRDVEVERVGFITTDDGRIGCSPDALVGADGGLEVKCPAPHTHVKYLLGDADPATGTQVQGGMWVAEREWWDVFSYNPGLPPVLLRRYRDEDFIADLETCVRRFVEELDAAREKLRAMGDVGRVEIQRAVAEVAA